jgi:methylated-DNA-[protein]-cysteine S-methyltransferase
MNGDSFTTISGPIGWIRIAGDDRGISAILFAEEDGGSSEDVPIIVKQCAAQLREYFEGCRKEFDLKLRPLGTDFQITVWNALQGIPFGVTRSYRELAAAIRNEKAIRAVGAANGQNKINIVVPCHRVIGSNGDLTGYGGELWRKKWLLDHEHAIQYGRQAQLF